MDEVEDRERDARRIGDELIGRDIGTDPFVAAVRATRMPMIVTDPRLPDNPVVFANDAFCRLTGYARDEVLGRNCRFLQGPHSDPETVRALHDAVKRERAIEIEIRNYRKDGSAFWNRLLLAPVPDAHGRLAYFFASQLDVTRERERLEGLEHDKASLVAELGERLRAQEDSERELRLTLDASGLGWWTLDVASRTLASSAACRESFTGRTEGPFAFDDMIAAIDHDDGLRLRAAIDRAIEGQEPFAIDVRLASAGEPRWIAVRGQPIGEADQVPRRISGVSTDVTDARRADRMRRAVLALVDRVRDLDDPADISFAAAETIGATLEVNRAGYGVIDRDAETITIERDWNAPGVDSLAGILHFRSYGSYIEDLKRGETVSVEDSRTDPRTAASSDALEGITARAFINMPVTEQGGFVALLYVNHGSARHWHEDEIAFMRDVAERTRVATERRRAEHGLTAFANSLEQQVADRTGELMEAEAALRQSQKLEAIGQLTGGVAHDFNNLLTVIRSSVDLMARPDLAPERRERYLAAISETVDRAAKLTGQLLAFARRQALKPEPFDVGRAVANLSDIVSTLAGSRIAVTIDAPEGRCFANADSTQFDTAIVNMAANARDAMDGEGRLAVSLAAVDAIPALRRHLAVPGKFVAVSLTDTGHGIATEDVGRIFEPFFTTKGVGKGTGLGLSQVFGFAKQSGGEVRVESEPGRGATFTLYLPRIDPPAIGEQPPATDRIRPDDPSALSILIVEDNEGVGTTTVQALEQRGYHATLTTNAREALDRLAGEARYDLVFSDVVMPGMNGIDLAHEIGRRHPGLPVVLASGYSEVLAEGGCDGFDLVHKPYTIDDFDAALVRALAGADADAR